MTVLSLGVLSTAAGMAQQPAPSRSDSVTIVDRQLTEAGRRLWSAKGCLACHTIGRQSLDAPDLSGLFVRRTPSWVRLWLQKTDSMLAADSTAMALLAEYNNLRMPPQQLSETEIDALMHYIADEAKKREK